MGKIKVSVPATTANLGAGFDCLGMALDIRNVFEFETGSSGFSATGEGARTLELDEGQLIYEAWGRAFVFKGKEAPPVRIGVASHIPIGRGLGSSATAVVAGLYAANVLGKLDIEQGRLLALATGLEGHPDNVAPALFGGLVVSGGHRPGEVDYAVLPPDDSLKVVLAVPDFELSTAEARSVLPKTVPFADAVFNTGQAALFVAAWVGKQWDLMGRNMEDRLHQPYRASLVLGLRAVMDAAKQAGALGAALSGAGPTVMALALGQTHEIGDAMGRAFKANGVSCRVMVTKVSKQGVFLVQGGIGPLGGI